MGDAKFVGGLVNAIASLKGSTIEPLTGRDALQARNLTRKRGSITKVPRV